MKKYCLIIVCMIISSMLFSACTVKNNSNQTIKYKRKLEKYFTTENTNSGAIDLSEGPKLRYDASFGPKDLNFDIKIINPY